VPLTTWPASRCGPHYQFTARLGASTAGNGAFKEKFFSALTGNRTIVVIMNVYNRTEGLLKLKDRINFFFL
jgi:hypothetical protein